MLSEEAKYRQDNCRQMLESICNKITLENFKKEFLVKSFSDDVHGKKEIEFFELKQRNMMQLIMRLSLRSYPGFVLTRMGYELKVINA